MLVRAWPDQQEKVASRVGVSWETQESRQDGVRQELMVGEGHGALWGGESKDTG